MIDERRGGCARSCVFLDEVFDAGAGVSAESPAQRLRDGREGQGDDRQDQEGPRRAHRRLARPGLPPGAR